MARLPRVVIPGYPHHVAQRGKRRPRTLFSYDEYKANVETIAREKKKAGVDTWAYYLMPNHAHLVAVPKSPDSLARLFGQLTDSTCSALIFVTPGAVIFGRKDSIHL